MTNHYNAHVFCLSQRSSVLGNKIEMEITELVEKNASLLRLGLHLEFNDARHRIANHLQRNIDRSKYIPEPTALQYSIMINRTIVS